MIGAVCLSFCLQSFLLAICVQDYCRINQPISLKLTVMIVWAYQSKELIGGAPVPAADCRSLFHFPHHYEIGDFRRFISISNTVTSRFFSASLYFSKRGAY